MIEIYETLHDEILVSNQTFNELMEEIKSRISTVRNDIREEYGKYSDRDCISLSYSSPSEKIYHKLIVTNMKDSRPLHYYIFLEFDKYTQEVLICKKKINFRESFNSIEEDIKSLFFNMKGEDNMNNSIKEEMKNDMNNLNKKITGILEDFNKKWETKINDLEKVEKRSDIDNSEIIKVIQDDSDDANTIFDIVSEAAKAIKKYYDKPSHKNNSIRVVMQKQGKGSITIKIKPNKNRYHVQIIREGNVLDHYWIGKSQCESNEYGKYHWYPYIIRYFFERYRIWRIDSVKKLKLNIEDIYLDIMNNKIVIIYVPDNDNSENNKLIIAGQDYRSNIFFSYIDPSKPNPEVMYILSNFAVLIKKLLGMLIK